VIEQARAIAARPEAAGSATTTIEDRITALYRAVLSRPPAPAELRTAQQFLDPAGPRAAQPGRSQLSRWEQLAQVLLMTNEFLFVD
jgi:hypothetical protein